MKTNIQIFTSDIFGEIRTCQVNNQIMFVGKDVATALGYSNTRDALRKHVDTEDKGTVAIRDTAYETRVTLINESGLYSLILSSKLPQAKAFKRWVTSEVLPQIRQTGGYIPTKDAQGRQLSNEEIINRADAIVCRTLCRTTGDRFMILCRITEPVPMVRKPSTRLTASPFRTVPRLTSTRKRGLPNSNPLFP